MLLAAFEVRSLAFHDLQLTWFQRVVILIDVAAVWLYFPSVTTSFRSLTRAWAALATCLLVVFLLFDASIPADRVRRLPERWNLTDHVFRERRLDLRGQILRAVEATSAAVGASRAPGLDLQGRDFRYADMSEATLIRPFLYGANFRGVRLERAKFVDADFSPAQGSTGATRRTSFAFALARSPTSPDKICRASTSPAPCSYRQCSPAAICRRPSSKRHRSTLRTCGLPTCNAPTFAWRA